MAMASLECLEAPKSDAASLARASANDFMPAGLPLAPLPAEQFRIFKSASRYARQPPFDNSSRIEIDNFIVECDKALRTTTIHGSDDSVIGLVLGNAFIAETGERLASRHFRSFDLNKRRVADFEPLYDQWCGSFVLLLFVDGAPYLYLDAGGCLSVVYSPELEIAGSTATAILSEDDYEARFNERLYNFLDVAHEGWFPSGLTAHRDVARLLCNHRLDLRSLSAARHWPARVPVRLADDRAVLDALGRSVGNNLNAVLANMPAAMGLTAGFDSRVLLSLVAPERRKDLTTFVVNAGTPNTDMDVYVSNEIARRFGLNHLTLEPLPRDEEGEERWHCECGHAIGGTNAWQHTALSLLVNIKAVVDGAGAETARCFFWKRRDAVDTALNGEMIVRRFGMPVAPEVIAATDRWLASVPPGDALFTLDLAYLELRVSAWAGCQCYVDSPKAHFSPFLSRRSIQAMFALPVAVKRSRATARAVIAANWPALLTMPFNKYGDIRDLYRVARKAKNPHVLLKKLRKMLAP